MKKTTRILREMMAQPGIIVVPGCYDALTAKIVERVGFKMVGLGGFALGASLATTEPLMCLEDVVRATRYITQAISIPLRVDAGAGFGEPLHVMRTVKELEAAGAANIFIEDQIYPKRAHYHNGIEHVITVEDYLAKLKAALAARQDPDLVIQARTDSMRTHNFAEGMRRANLALEAGADLVSIFPNTYEEAKQAPKEIAGPVSILNSEGNLLDRPLISNQELEDMGYKFVTYAIGAINVAAKAVKEMTERLYAEGRPITDPAEMRAIRKYIQDTIGLEEMYRIEKETVER